ncbi:hypothetical protein AB4142_32590, partial [Variovorax sp. 2RAF20]
PTISYGEKPVIVRLGPDGARVSRDGRKARVEKLSGELVFLTDGETAWHFHDDPSRPRQTLLESVYVAGPAKQLLITPPTGYWVREDYA